MKPPKISITNKFHNLTNRDQKILRYLSQVGLASSALIGNQFWKTTEHGNHLRRLRFLQKKGLVEKIYSQTNQLLGYRLSVSGIRYLGMDTEIFRKVYQSQMVRSLDHDQNVIQAGRILEQCHLVSDFRTDQLLRAQFALKYGKMEKKDSGYKVPDAIFKLQTTQSILTVALEMELTQKSEKRYYDILKQMSLSEDFTTVFFLVQNSTIQKKIESVLKEVRSFCPAVKALKQMPGFYFCEWEKFQKEELDVLFCGEGQSFSLNSLVQKVNVARSDTLQPAS